MVPEFSILPDELPSGWWKAGGGTPGGVGGARSATATLPCLYSNNSVHRGVDGSVNQLTPAHKRTAFSLAFNIQALAKKYGLERLGFLTLTFAENIQTIKEASRRLNNLRSDVLVKRYPASIRVLERMKSGRIHYHLVVVLDQDIRQGADFEAFLKGDYRSANPALRAEWAWWRRTSRAYGFGRTELLPVRSTAEGIARYVGKYVSKHVGHRQERDQGARLVGYLGFQPGERKAGTTFTWRTDGSMAWRFKLETWAYKQGARDLADLHSIFGARWAYIFKDEIMSIPIGDTYKIRRKLGEPVLHEAPVCPPPLIATRRLQAFARFHTDHV